MNEESSKSAKHIQILHIVDGFRMGGAESKLYELIQKTDRDRFKVLLANVGPHGPLSEAFLSLDIPIYDIPRRHRFDLIPIVKLYRIIKSKKIDIIQTTLFWADFIGILVGTIAGVRARISWETVTHSGKYYHNKFQRLFGYRFVMHFCDKIVAVSEQVKQSLNQYPGLKSSRIRVIRYGVDLDRFKPLNGSIRIQKRKEFDVPANSIVLAVVGRLEPQKGHHVLLDALSALMRQNDELYIFFIGDGSQRQSIENSIKAMGMINRIRILGQRSDICEILNSTDLFCLPSIAGEGLPNAILEAMACGRAIVATDVGGSRELITNGVNGILVQPNDSGSLRTAISKLISNVTLLQSQSAAALNFVQEHHSLQKQMNEFHELYLELSGNTRSLRRKL